MFGHYRKTSIELILTVPTTQYWSRKLSINYLQNGRPLKRTRPSSVHNLSWQYHQNATRTAGSVRVSFNAWWSVSSTHYLCSSCRAAETCECERLQPFSAAVSQVIRYTGVEYFSFRVKSQSVRFSVPATTTSIRLPQEMEANVWGRPACTF